MAKPDGRAAPTDAMVDGEGDTSHNGRDHPKGDV